MRLEEILSIDNNQIVTESGIKTAIGNAPHEVGDMVWVDGSCVFGNQRNSQPVMAVDIGAGIPPVSCIIIAGIASSSADGTNYLMLFVVDTKNLETQLILRSTFLDSGVCGAMADYGVFCYNENLTGFSLIGSGQTRGYESLYQINYGTLESHEVRVCGSSEMQTSIVAWYEQGDTQECKWRVFLTNGSTYYRKYVYDKNISNIYATVQKNYDDITCEFKDFINNTLTSTDDETSTIMNAIKSYDSDFLEKYKGVGISHVSWQTPTELPTPAYGSWELVNTVTNPVPRILSEEDYQGIDRSYWLAEGKGYPNGTYQDTFIYNNGNIILCTDNNPNKDIPISGPTIAAYADCLSIRAKSIATDINNILSQYLNCGHWGFGNFSGGDYGTGAEIINSEKPKTDWMGLYNRMACFARYNFSETIIDGNVVKDVFDASNTTENEVRNYPSFSTFTQALWFATQNKIQTKTKDEEYHSYNEDRTVRDTCNILYYDIWSFTLPASINIKSSHTVSEPFDYGFYFNKEYDAETDGFSTCTLTNGTFSKVLDITGIQCLSVDTQKNPIIINGLKITKYDKKTGEEMKTTKLTLNGYSLVSISTSALRVNVHLQSLKANLSQYFEDITS